LPLSGRRDDPRGPGPGDQRRPRRRVRVGRVPRVRRAVRPAVRRHLGALPGLPDGAVARHLPPALV